MEDLEALIPAPRVVTTALGDISVLPIVTAQIPPFLRHARPLLDQLDSLLIVVGADAGEAVIAPPPDWMSLIEQHGESAIAAIAVATGKTADQIGTLPPDQTLALLQAIVEENLDFFVRRILPATRSLVVGLLSRLATLAGRMSSSDSSLTATGAPTS
ncbi:hypothetical protein [Rhodocyclus tenuis]|uniref:Uncharacterized protein n=1 Tax=Rhodocyclus tenuis TaxID=1066 RepID=A0A840G5T1_RHOTE|nr:hypothetical protein [Rhodocyclus tenuis]MBB4247245.1 hypothetical protein [Rhodocyclus tenuis]